MAIDYKANKHMLFAGYNFAINKEQPGSALHLDAELTLDKLDLIEDDVYQVKIVDGQVSFIRIDV